MNQKKILYAVALMVMCALPANSYEPKTLATPHPQIVEEVVTCKIVTGLVDLTRVPRAHWYTPHFRGEPTFHVRTAEGTTDKFTEDEFKQLKKAYKQANFHDFPDLRSYEFAHPKCVKVQKGFEHWMPVGQGMMTIAVPAAIGINAAVRPKTTVQVSP